MRNCAVVVSVVGVLALGAAVGAQDRPNFTGVWVQVSPTEGAGTAQHIKHEGDRLSTAHDSNGGGHASTYRLDGVESRNVVTSHGTDIVSKTVAAWEGQQLVMTSATEYPDGRRTNDKQVWSLDSTGQLVIVMTRTMTGLEPMSIKLVFAKKSSD